MNQQPKALKLFSIALEVIKSGYHVKLLISAVVAPDEAIAKNAVLNYGLNQYPQTQGYEYVIACFEVPDEILLKAIPDAFDAS